MDTNKNELDEILELLLVKCDRAKDILAECLDRVTGVDSETLEKDEHLKGLNLELEETTAEIGKMQLKLDYVLEHMGLDVSLLKAKVADMGITFNDLSLPEKNDGT